MPPPLELRALQQWMQAVITHPGSLGDAVRSDAASALLPPARINEVFIPAPPRDGGTGLEPEERLAIYHRMYRLRLEESLAEDYGALREAMGEDAFSRLALDYVTAHPSRSYTLVRLSDALPEFLERWPRARRWHPDLARLESARYQAFECEDDPGLDEAALRSLPAQAWPQVRLLPAWSLRLCSMRYAVNDFYEAWRKDEPLHAPARRLCRVAVLRRGDSLVRVVVEGRAWALLQALVAGEPLGAAMVHVPASAAPLVFDWLRAWVAAGFFRAVA